MIWVWFSCILGFKWSRGFWINYMHEESNPSPISFVHKNPINKDSLTVASYVVSLFAMSNQIHMQIPLKDQILTCNFRNCQFTPICLVFQGHSYFPMFSKWIPISPCSQTDYCIYHVSKTIKQDRCLSTWHWLNFSASKCHKEIRT